MVRDGQYLYRPHRNLWGIFRYHDHGNGISANEFVKDVRTKEEASEEVYRLNGWK